MGFTCTTLHSWVRMSPTEMTDFSWVTHVTSGWLPLSICRQEMHFPQGSSPPSRHSNVAVKSVATSLFPTPSGPSKRYAWDTCPLRTDSCRYEITRLCPTTLRNVSMCYPKTLSK